MSPVATPPIDFTPMELVEAVRALAQEYPEAVYEKPGENSVCLYSAGKADGGVGCIVGQALKRLGCSDEYVSKLDRLDSCGIDHVAKRHFWPDLAGWIDEWEEATEDVPEINWLSVVQMEQDSGHSWGAALETADIDQPLHKPKYVKQDQQN